MIGRFSLFAAVCAATLLGCQVAQAQPARIILLRHAEKSNSYALCAMGKHRADALQAQFLGKDAANSLFGANERPDAFLAVTLHPLETVTPAARSWGLPVITYSVVPGENDNDDDEAKQQEIDRRTREAAQDLMTQKEYDGKTVVVAWEHKHIANHKLEKDNKGEDVTLRQLLGLKDMPDVPETWSDSNYDYFWIVDYQPGSRQPVGFRMVKQAFAAPFDNLPAPDWGEPEPAHEQAGCKK